MGNFARAWNWRRIGEAPTTIWFVKQRGACLTAAIKVYDRWYILFPDYHSQHPKWWGHWKIFGSKSRGLPLLLSPMIIRDIALHADILPVRIPRLNFYVLRDSSGLYLLDAGFIGGRRLLQRALRARGWEREPIRGIIVTHGHLDHILNVAAIARETGAWIAAPRLDADHYSGHPHYCGAARFTGCLESLGRPLLSFQPFVPNRLLDDGDFLDVWHGLQAETANQEYTYV